MRCWVRHCLNKHLKSQLGDATRVFLDAGTYDVGLVGCQQCAVLTHMGIHNTYIVAVCHVSCKKMYLYLYFTMYFIRNNNVITEPGSINRGAPSVSALPRGPLPSHQGKDLGLLPCRGTKAPLRPRETKQLRLANPGVLWTPRLPSLRNILQSMVKSIGGIFGVWIPAPGFCPSSPQKKAKFWRVD